MQVPDSPRRFIELSPYEKRRKLLHAGPDELQLFSQLYGANRLTRIQQVIRQSGELSEESALEGSRPNVVLIPGIMGSELAVSKQGRRSKLIWIDLQRVFLEDRLGDLRLAADGRTPAVKGVVTSAPGILSLYFDELEQFLLPRYNVRRFAYDWRRDVRDVAGQLHAFLQLEFGDQPVHLISHSMGALVARALIANRLANGAPRLKVLGDGGRLIMLAPPNLGSFEGIKILSGVQDAIQLLAAGLQTAALFFDDLEVYVAQVRKLVHSFPAVYQLLPRPDQLPTEFGVDFYNRNGYLRVGNTLSNAHFHAARLTHTLLEEAVIPEVMRIVAGCDLDEATSVGLESASRICPETKFTKSFAGDGIVPHHLSMLSGVPQYYVKGGHGDVVEDRSIMESIDDLLFGDPGQVRLSRTPITMELELPNLESSQMPSEGRAEEQSRFKAAVRAWRRGARATGRNQTTEHRLIEQILSGWMWSE